VSVCGIAGLVGRAASDDDVLERMAARMIHRGPDAGATWSDGAVGLAARRLAIIDLDERSNQPLHLGSWHLVFNGEIYNYRELRSELRSRGHSFETEGDGEVLLHAWVEWEEAALERLNGMFALAIWNDERRELVCARDIFGEKPLFWANGEDGFAFASEIRALLEARPDLSAHREDAVCAYLGLGLLPPVGDSFFAGIHQLPGAHLLHLRDGRAEVRRYWSPRRVDVAADFADATDQLRELLVDSIRLRLRSDVPVGTSLSGGVDSSSILCLAGRIAGDHRRHAFTARFPGFERDEWAYAHAAADAAGVVEHHAVEPTSIALLDELDTVVQFQEEPFGSSSIYAQWQVMRAAHEQGVTVLLDGQGADELFGGYAGSNGWALRSTGPTGIFRGLTSGRDRVDLLLALGSDLAPRAAVRAHRRRLTTPYAAAAVRDAAARETTPTFEIAEFDSPLARELLRQSFHTSMPGLLRYADRNSMAHSREVRLPFLDRRIAEFAYSLPPDFLYRGGVTKAILRAAVRGIVPDSVLDRPEKVGYETPQSRWLAEPAFVARIRDVLLDPSARGRRLYATEKIESDVRAGRWRDPQGIWRALNLEVWLRTFERSPAGVA
jgi:asparagine synthase (glutamine-hydrolysing)